MRDVSKNLKHNERKAQILFLLTKTKKYLYVADIAQKLGITTNNSIRQMSKLSRQRYIYRRKQRFGKHKGEYEYRFLKQRGRRMCKELWIRTKLREIDPSVSFNFKKKPSIQHTKHWMELELQYTKWLLSSEP